MSLVHVYEWDYYAGQGEDHHVFSLRDYKKKYHWIGHWNHTTQTVIHCQLELFSRTWQPYCIARDATRRGSGTIGENNKVDFGRLFMMMVLFMKRSIFLWSKGVLIS